MHDRLREIIAEKHKEVSRLKKRGLSESKVDNMPPIRDFKAAISAPGKINLIAEIKFSSPSAGVIHKKTDPLEIGRIYEISGAAAISFLTDAPFFGGDLDQLPFLKRAINLPILRKDFIIDEIQIKESFAYGADAILLIVRILEHRQLKDFLAVSREYGMTALTEVHSREDLDMAIDCGARIIGINNRDLDTFDVDLNTTLELAPFIPDKYVAVSESGIKKAKDIILLKKYGIQAVLVGSSIMKSSDIETKTRELVGAGKS
jgi:indole-3-glycerol phosphate synthase